jgi:hypothetical protein
MLKTDMVTDCCIQLADTEHLYHHGKFYWAVVMEIILIVTTLLHTDRTHVCQNQKKPVVCWAPVVQTCNPSYSGAAIKASPGK